MANKTPQARRIDPDWVRNPMVKEARKQIGKYDKEVAEWDAEQAEIERQRAETIKAARKISA